MTTAARTVVIGAGTAGLAAAVILAEAGHRVTVLEQHRVAGGQIQSFRRGRLQLETGFHFITASNPGGLFRRLARRLGIREQLRFLAPASAAQFRFCAGERPFDLPLGISASRQALTAANPGQAASIDRFFAALRGEMRALPWLAEMAEAGPSAEPGERSRTTAAVLAASGLTGRAAAVVTGLGSILGLEATALPFATWAAVCGTALAGSWRLAGGGEALVTALTERLARLGATVQLGAGAASVRWSGREVESVVDEHGAAYPADLVVATCHPAELVRICGEDAFRPSFVARVADLADSVSAVVVHARLGTPVPPAPASHLLLTSDRGRPVYAVCPHGFDGSEGARFEIMEWIPCAEAGPWSATRLGQRSDAYRAWKEERAAALLTAFAAAAPGLGTVERTWTASPLTIRDYTRSRNGAAFGLSHDVDQLGRHPLSHRNRLRNLFLAGQSVTHPGILGTVVGAVDLAGRLVERDLRAEVLAADGD